MTPHPPKNALKFLRWFCREDYLEEIEGDLIELFEKQCEQSPRRAARRFFWQVLRHFRPDFIKSFSTNPLIHPGMIKHNLVIAYRSFLRDKSSFLINLLGLSSGLACALLIFLWVRDEMQMDKFHEKDAQLYQVMQRYNTPAGVKVVDWSPGPLAEALKAETPEVEYAARAKMGVGFYDGILTYGEKHLRAAPIYVQEEYLDVFSYPLLHGDKSRALTDKYAVLISEEMALKLFSSTEEAVGKTIEWTKKFGDIVDFSGVFTITGVFKYITPKATTKFFVIFPFEM